MWPSFFKKKSSVAPVSYAFLQVDMHAHFLPGLDDGAATMEESLAHIQHLHQLGYTKLIASPHISQEFYPNTIEKIQTALSKVQQAVSEKGWPLTIAAAAEYMVDDLFMQTLAANKPLLTLDGRHVLIEMGYVAEHPLIKEAIFQLRALGYIPVLAHPERYYFYHRKPEKIAQLVENGCKLQLNILSLTGYYGSAEKKQAGILLEGGQYHFAGTDSHHTRHLQALSALSTVQIDLLTQYKFENSQL